MKLALQVVGLTCVGRDEVDVEDAACENGACGGVGANCVHGETSDREDDIQQCYGMRVTPAQAWLHGEWEEASRELALEDCDSAREVLPEQNLSHRNPETLQLVCEKNQPRVTVGRRWNGEVSLEVLLGPWEP